MTPSRLAVGGAVAIGIILRLADFIRHRSLWTDEVLLGISIAVRPYERLFPPLAHDQSAPIGFLWLERLAVNLGGVSEWSLRIIPLIVGVAVLGLSYPIARRFVEPATGIVVTMLIAVAPVLVYYSAEAKQYGLEALVTFALLGGAIGWLDRPTSTRAHTLLGLGAASAGLSAGAPFVLSGVWLILVIYMAQGRAESRRLLFQATLLWGLAFVAAYLLVYRHAVGNPYMSHFWAPAFLGPGNPSLLHNAGTALQSVLWGVLVGREPLATTVALHQLVISVLTATLCLLVIAGWKEIHRLRGLAGLILVTIPILSVLVASACGLYPVALRTMLFAAPLLGLAAAAGTVRAATTVFGPDPKARHYALVGLFLLFPTYWSIHDLLQPSPREHLRPLIETYRARRDKREPIYVFVGSIPAWAFYTTEWSTPDTNRLAMLEAVARPGGSAFSNAPPRGRPVSIGEGQRLRSVHSDELLGIPTGLERNSSGLLVSRVDAGWATHEAERVRAAGIPGIWVLMSHFFGPEGSLLTEIERLGGRRTYARHGNNSFLARYEFTGR